IRAKPPGHYVRTVMKAFKYIREKNMPKVVVVYLSTSGNTKAMAEAVVEGVKSRNVDAIAMNFHEARIE
ncbi:MAG TPA: hypothetical protein VIO11_03175, partial [Candidatus Methanoperedens sp.]